MYLYENWFTYSGNKRHCWLEEEAYNSKKKHELWKQSDLGLHPITYYTQAVRPSENYWLPQSVFPAVKWDKH